jgi:hypothetical protein
MLHRGSDAFATEFINDQQSFEPSRVAPPALHGRWIRIRGGQPAFEALLSVSCANPKRPNSGCCAFCEFFVANPGHPVDGSLADDMEAVRPHNLPALLRSSRAISQGADPGDEKACVLSDPEQPARLP